MCAHKNLRFTAPCFDSELNGLLRFSRISKAASDSSLVFQLFGKTGLLTFVLAVLIFMNHEQVCDCEML